MTLPSEELTPSKISCDAPIDIEKANNSSGGSFASYDNQQITEVDKLTLKEEEENKQDPELDDDLKQQPLLNEREEQRSKTINFLQKFTKRKSVEIIDSGEKTKRVGVDTLITYKKGLVLNLTGRSHSDV